MTKSKKDVKTRPKFQKPIDNKKRHENTTIADRLRTVSSSNNSNPTGVVKPVYGYQTIPLIAKAV